MRSKERGQSLPQPDSLNDLGLLLRLLEAPRLIFTYATLANRQSQALLASGLIEAAGHEKVFIDTEDEDGTAFEVGLDPERGRFGFRHPLRGWTDVDPAVLQLYRPNLGAIFFKLLGEQLRQPVNGPIEVEPNLVWEFGLIRLGTNAPTMVWLARRLGDRAAWEQLRQVTVRRPPTSHRLVLTPTLHQYVLPLALTGSTVVSIADVIDPYRPACISFERLRARFQGRVAEPVVRVINLSDDNSWLVIHGKELIYRGKKLQAIIRQLYDAHQQNKWLKAADILEKADSLSDSLDQAFGRRWNEIRPHLENQGHLWRFAPSI